MTCFRSPLVPVFCFGENRIHAELDDAADSGVQRLLAALGRWVRVPITLERVCIFTSNLGNIIPARGPVTTVGELTPRVHGCTLRARPSIFICFRAR